MNRQIWLLTGGAGYIGAHVAAAMRRADREVLVVDDLSTGDPARVPADVELVAASVLDTTELADVMKSHRIAGVIHLAAKKAVAESVDRPLHYYQQNVHGTASVLQAMSIAGVRRLVLSSSAAVYGVPPPGPVTESTPTTPINPYGVTKLICEWLVRDAASSLGLSWIGLRYFNVAGAGDPSLGDPGVANLMQLTLQALSRGSRPQVYGRGHDTQDGSCVRDYVHVADLADAHLAAVDHLHSRDTTRAVYNVGCGRGYSVLEVLAAAQRVTGIRRPYEVVAARPVDPPSVVADPARIRADLGWSARYDLDAMVRSAWDAWQYAHTPALTAR
ncbi:UDP-glucose 4-epimerase [Kribbella amoyensis]|uniref:UDP-glucose 4-epimerase n=1 Tax=Kribbella amoyensis TaxID=996641 RepID=A0A561BMV3_9ACTN|nr:UDP-glucose 4-epimerase GalE [Kribbella amoyensis]TWD80178.1 UDP-glucose 4-epimerase [Kribbella amoyensis]